MTAPHIQAVVEALRAVVSEIDGPDRPRNDDSYLPPAIMEQIHSALAEYERVEAVGTRHSSTDSHAVMAAEIARLRSAMKEAHAIVKGALDG